MSTLSSNPIDAIRAWVKGQWERVPTTPMSQPGSYARGYDNALIDTLRGLSAQLNNLSPTPETGVIVSTAGDELNGESPRAGASVGQPSPAVGHVQKPALDSDGRVSSHPSFCRCEVCAHPVPAPALKAGA